MRPPSMPGMTLSPLRLIATAVAGLALAARLPVDAHLTIDDIVAPAAYLSSQAP